MRPIPGDSQPEQVVSRALLCAVALVSAALISYEIVLMRRLLVESWHHFGYLVISSALLGFGASGTLLAVFERRVRARPGGMMFWLAAALLLSLVVLPRLAAELPVAARFIPADLWRQVGWWSLYWLAALLPFLLGAGLIGTALMTAGPAVARVYAANLFGSAAGAMCAALLVSRFALERGLWPSLGSAAVAALVLSFRDGAAWRGVSPAGLGGPALQAREPTNRARLAVALLLALLAIIVEVPWPLVPRFDEYKYGARLELLAAQGSARRIAARADPHGYVELHESSLFHDLPFLAPAKSPPPMYSLTINGDPAGSVLRIDDHADADVMDHTLMAFPYRLMPARPRVLLMGETGGANIWLARRYEAERIDAVQPNAALIDILREYSGPLLDSPGLRFVAQSPRRFLQAAQGAKYDLIQVVSLEGLGLGGAGARGLAEDHLATVEGFAACLRLLSDQGVLAISRGLQTPPRENLRILATLAEALESIGVDKPAPHMVQVRDYLGVCTLALKSPLTGDRRKALRTAHIELNLTPTWYDSLWISDVNQPDAMDGPPGVPWDWLHHAAREILSPRREQFYDDWLLNVRPPRDDRPFFWDFYKPGAVAALKQAYGDLWLTRAELGRLFLYASLAVAGAAAVVLILAPLAIVSLWRRRPATRQVSPAGLGGPALQGSSVRGSSAHGNSVRGSGVLPMLVYFGGIGLGFMAIEMALISRAIHWLGDPVIAGAVVIGGVLTLSGVGSLAARRLVGDRIWIGPALVAVLAVVLRLLGWSSLGGELFGAIAMLVAGAIAALCMGLPMPAGLAALDRCSAPLVPWAWGVNGVASVIATSAAIVVAMTAGYGTVVILAAAAYTAAALAARRLARQT